MGQTRVLVPPVILGFSFLKTECYVGGAKNPKPPFRHKSLVPVTLEAGPYTVPIRYPAAALESIDFTHETASFAVTQSGHPRFRM